MKITTLITLLILSCTTVLGQSTEEDLYDQLAAMDSLMFRIAFDSCDFEMMERLTHEDLEFYHDLGGINYSQEEFLETMRTGLCKTGKNTIRRELVTGSLEVYPLRDNGVLYGAVQMGSHRFGPAGEAVPEHHQKAKFVHLWLLDEEGYWKISRVLSFNH